MSGIPAWAVKGAKVVCVRGFEPFSDLQREIVPSPPVEGGIYTVDRAETCTRCGILDLVFVEITATFEGERVGFDIAHFRPVVTRTQEQDVAIFAPLLSHREVETA